MELAERVVATDTSDLFELELILPTQFWSHRDSDDRGAPERRLMLAVLEDAILTLRTHLTLRSSQSRRYVAETEAWFRSESRAHAFAFGSICDVLGIEPACIRRAIRTWLSGRRAVPRYHRAHSGTSRHQIQLRVR